MKTTRCLIAAATLAFPGSIDAETVPQVGHLPNITHAQGLVAHNGR